MHRQRLVILPDRRNSIEGIVFGAALLLGGLYFGLNWLGISLIVLGALCVASSALSIRGVSSLPRIEIDNQGIREVSHFGVTQAHQWTVITWFEPHFREHADGTDHVLRIKTSGSSPSKKAEHSDLNLNCYLPTSINREDATVWIADWLEEFRQQAGSRTDALQALRAPKYLKSRFV
jgi:hypothetical protein